jgi:hypothetical protein
MFGTDLPSTSARRPYSPADLQLVIDTFDPAAAERSCSKTLPGSTVVGDLTRPEAGETREVPLCLYTVPSLGGNVRIWPIGVPGVCLCAPFA